MLLALALIAVSPLHPRVYVRADSAPVGKGITVSQLRARLKDPAFTRWRAPANYQGLTGVLERAARYLETGEAADLEAVRDHLQTHTYSYEKNDVGGFLAGAEMATAFDWVYAGLSPSDRLTAMDKIATTCDSSRRFLERGGPDINHNYTYMALASVAVCGLAMSGEAEPYGTRAGEYLAIAKRFIEGPGMVLDTWKARECAWSEGSHYTFFETLRNFVLMLQAYRSASGTDYFAGRPWLAGAGRFLMACTRPDFTFERIGDTSPNRVETNLDVPLTVEMLAEGLDDPEEAARLRSFDDAIIERYGDKSVYSGYQWGLRIFRDPKARRNPSYTTLPLAMRLGAGTYEHIAWRSGWKNDSTLVTILGGDHFTDHQHFDKGQFLISHLGGLAVDSGTYDGMYKKGGHSGEYAARTLAHNCLLIFDPNQDFKGYANDGGQLLLRGMQHHGNWPRYLEHREKEGLDTAEVLAYDAGSGYDYALVDLTHAYGPKAKSYQRSFVYLPSRDVLVVYDKVDAAFEKRWLLHFQTEPEIRDGAVTVRRPEGGVLVVKTLAPGQAKVEAVGGPGREYLNPFNNMNYPPSRPPAAIREAGNWRMEVTGGPEAGEFLHAMSIGRAVESRAVKGVPGAHFLLDGRGEVVAFPAALPASYEVSAAAPAEHIVAGLPKNTVIDVKIGKKSRRLRTNQQGLLRFEDGAKGARTIRLRQS